MSDKTNVNPDEDDDLQLDPNITLSGRIGQQLLQRLLIGDSDSLADDARDLIVLFAQQAMVSGSVSVNLQMWVAESFRRYLNGDAKSLDAAFNLKMRGRPLLMTPKVKRKVIQAYFDALRAAQADGVEGRKAEIMGEHAAYVKVHGRTVEEDRWSPDVEGAVADRLDRIRAVLKEFSCRR